LGTPLAMPTLTGASCAANSTTKERKMSDHDLLIILIVFVATFFIVDAAWKFGIQVGIQDRLNKLERK
jgi:hypothetical protein